MSKFIVMVMIGLLVACSGAAPSDTVESLVAHPNLLRQVARGCRDDFEKMGAGECNAAAEAQRRLFMGNGKTHYTSPKDPPKF